MTRWVVVGGSFLRITNATLEFVGSSNTVRQRRLLRFTSILGSWGKKCIHFPPGDPWAGAGQDQALLHIFKVTD